MTRQVKGPGTDVLERDYVYADPPISITELAEKYGLARSNVADKAGKGKWFEKREEFRRKLSDKTRDALAEKWAEMRIALYERLAKTSMTYLDKYEAALSEEGSRISINTKDMLGIAAMMRALTADMADKAVPSNVVDPDGDTFDGSAEEAQAVIARVKALMSGEAVEGE